MFLFIFSASAWRSSYVSNLSSPGSDSGYSDHAEALWSASKASLDRQQRLKMQANEAEVQLIKLILRKVVSAFLKGQLKKLWSNF